MMRRNQLISLTTPPMSAIANTAPLENRIAHGEAGRARMLTIMACHFRHSNKRQVSHESGNTTVRISILRED